jgi:uracil-DNA glycosylase family 4
MNHDQILEEYYHILATAEQWLDDGFTKPVSPVALHWPQKKPLVHATAEQAPQLVTLPSFSSLSALSQAVSQCQSCPLHATRTCAVPGMGVLQPDVVVVGEAPGADEDTAGQPFVGKSGQYLDKWLESIGLSRQTNCYITNVVKCRPPSNRDPHTDEIAACSGYVRQQIALLKPKAILACGRFAAQTLLDSPSALIRLRSLQNFYEGIPVFVTYHPAAVLRNPQDLRRPVWEDMKLLKQYLEGLT